MKNKYTLESYDGQVSPIIHKAAFEYCQHQRWYSPWHETTRNQDIDPQKKEWLLDRTLTPQQRFMYRVPFGWDNESLKNHPPIYKLFHHINNKLFDGRFMPAGFREGIRDIWDPAKFEVPWWNPKSTEESEQWKRGNLLAKKPPAPSPGNKFIKTPQGKGFTCFMAAQPYECVKRTKSIHRDYETGRTLDNNDEGYMTLIFVSNIEWKPSWNGEILYYEDGPEGADAIEKHGESFEYGAAWAGREESIGWPTAIMANVPGRVILQDSRWWHSTKPTTVLAPELGQHISFRVKYKPEFIGKY
jgi:hypothetical protein